MKKIIPTVITIVMLAAALAVCSFGFDDVDEGKWYTEGVLFCHANEYMAGVSETVFDRNGEVTRAMFMTILAKVDGADLTGYEGRSSFKDVKNDGWYTPAIEWGYQKGLAGGIGEGIFGYKNPVTREQIALFLYVYGEYVNGLYTDADEPKIDLSAKGDLSVYTDTDRLHGWAEEAMEWAVGAGLIGGSGEGILDPRGNCSRAQLSVIIRKFVTDLLSDCEHQWAEVTCTENGYCSVCNMLSAKAPGHDFEDHICTQSADCLRCGFEKIPEEHELTVGSCTEDVMCLKCGYVDKKAPGHSFYNQQCTVCSAFVNVHVQMHYYLSKNYTRFKFKEATRLDETGYNYEQNYYGKIQSGVNPYGYRYDFCVGNHEPNLGRGNIHAIYVVYDENGKIIYMLDLGITTPDAEVYNFSYYCPIGTLSGGFNKKTLDKNFNFVKYGSNTNEKFVGEKVRLAKEDLAFTLALLEDFMQRSAGGASLEGYGFNTEKLFG